VAGLLKLKSSGTEFENMPSVWWFESGRMLMSVYVDDLTLSGKKSSHASFWKELQQYVNLDPATDFGRVLGRDHVLQDGSLVLGSSDFAKRCIALNQELSGKSSKSREIATS